MKRDTNKNIINGYVNRDTVIDISTIKATNENPCYVIDKRLLNELLSKVTKGDLDDIKQDIFDITKRSNSKDELFSRLDNYIYLNNIIQLVEQSNDTSTKEVANNE